MQYEKIKKYTAGVNLNDNDFKFVVKDFSSTQIGARFSYEEMLMNENVPFKFQNIIQLYILKDTSPNTTIGEHVLSMEPNSFDYNIYSRLKLKVRFCEPRSNGGFKVITMKFSDFKDYQAKNWTDAHVIQELGISNLSLMGFTV